MRAIRVLFNLVMGYRWCVMAYLPEHGGRYVITGKFRTRLAAELERARVDLDAAVAGHSPHLVGRLP